MAPSSKPAEKLDTPLKSAASKRTARKPNAAFMKPLIPTPALAAVIGTQARPRTQVTQDIWVYIREHNLQDANDRRQINADEKLRVLFCKDQISMFELPKVITANLKAE